ncbi:hypothetical protein [Bacillus sp. JJ722]|uniref:hypothetical protein n=1 Tax=Bacillus sp. JJ722 TaxID=3122973 RepID=UPI002FFE8CBB
MTYEYDEKYSLYHALGVTTFPTLKKLIDAELTANDFIQETPFLYEQLGNKKVMMNKITTALFEIGEEELSKLSVKHLIVHGLSESHINMLLQHGITLQNLNLLSYDEFYAKTGAKELAYNRIMDAYGELLKLHHIEGIPFNQYKDEMQIAEEQLEAYLSMLADGQMFTLLELSESIPNVNEDIIKSFIEKQLLYTDGIRYRKKYKDLSFYIGEQSTIRNKDILIERISGKTLQEIAEELGVTRQAINNKEKSAISKISFTEEEAKYAHFYKHFDCPKELFLKLFNEEEYVYNFLSLRCRKGNENIIDSIGQYPFTEEQLQILLENNSSFINFQNKVCALSKPNIFLEVLYRYGQESTNDEEMLNHIKQYLIDHNLDENLFSTFNEVRGFSDRCSYVLQDRNQRYRFYDFEQITDEEIQQVEQLLLDLPPGAYNMLKVYKENKNLMDYIDIRNENELHNLYRRFLNVGGVTYGRMPEFSIGISDKKEFIINLFREFAPVHIDEFLEFVHEMYGLRINSLRSYIQMYLYEYVQNDCIQVEQAEVTDEELQYLQSLLVNDIYILNEIVQVGSQVISDFSPRLVNNILFNKFGYTLKGQFIVKYEYRNIERYFTQKILEKDFFKNPRHPIHKTQIFAKAVYDLEKSNQIFKISDDEHISLTRLEQAGVTLQQIHDFKNQVKTFVGEANYFTLKQIRSEGFTHPLFDIGFEPIFYERILWTDESIRAITLATNYILIVQDEDVTLSTFLHHIIEQFESIAAEDLLQLVKNKFGIQLHVHKVIATLQKTAVYYSPEMSTFYLNKEMFLNEIYN